MNQVSGFFVLQENIFCDMRRFREDEYLSAAFMMRLAGYILENKKPCKLMLTGFLTCAREDSNSRHYGP